jgi:hypothetical protein
MQHGAKALARRCAKPTRAGWRQSRSRRGHLDSGFSNGVKIAHSNNVPVMAQIISYVRRTRP